MLGVPDQVRSLFAEPFHLGLVLLGDAYLKACALGRDLSFGSPALLCGSQVARKLPNLSGLRAVTLARSDAARFHCGLVGLKGEIAGR